MPDCLNPQSRSTAQTLPMPDSRAQAVSDRLTRQIGREIEKMGGSMPFDRFMERALYAPGLGYYVAGSRKFGESGDFITAPEVSPLFAQCLARQIGPVMDACGSAQIMEFGAGSGRLATDLLIGLEQMGQLPERYAILEVSPELRTRQKETLQAEVPHLMSRVAWLEQMPERFSGCVIANELLDAMPVSRFRIHNQTIEECFVEVSDTGFEACFRAVRTAGLEQAVMQLQHQLGRSLPDDYETEINLRQAAWLKALGQTIQTGAVLLIDYGYSSAEYYHPQRNRGTLMCHYRHRAHSDPYRWLGLQDITSHVDFTAAARAALEAGFNLGGYTTQAHFLLANGLDTLLAESDPNDVARHMALVQGVKKLTLPSEMGEKFKVLGLLKGLSINLQGFSLRDFCERL
ncbi:MAG: SAM-dependent methyltransferase [Candidatus Thiodiazotropha sp.]